MRILGISAFYHDSAAALIEDGRILAAAQEERFTRRKHDPGFPRNAIRYCLEQAQGGRIDHVALYEKPLLKFERLIETYVTFAPRGLRSFCTAMPIWARQKLLQRRIIARELAAFDPGTDWAGRLLFIEHHHSHAASAFYPSPFERAAILVLDGVGEWPTTSAGTGNGTAIRIHKEIHFPHSLGLLYSAFTYYTGFRVNSGEYKLMGLAPYGSPRFAARIYDHLIDVKPDGSFRLNIEYFDYCTGLRMTNGAFSDLFGQAPRRPDGEIRQFHMDIAASVQSVVNDVMLKLTRSLAAETGEKCLCLAGGVALNCVANGEVLRDGRFKKIWIQPAAGDAGGAVGAALAAYYQPGGETFRSRQGEGDGMAGAFLGPEFSQNEIQERLCAAGAVLTMLPLDELIDASARALAQGKALGWFQGRMEFGPRALGARSILADPRLSSMQATLNLKVKYRESFRPFAPAVLAERAAEYFDLACDSPYMLLVAGVHPSRRLPSAPGDEELFGLARLSSPRSEIPAVTHVDYSARIQTVHRKTNPLLHALISRFCDLTGCPVLVNTSFNVRGEPIVCTPEDAFRCFMGTQIEALAAGNCFLSKEQQNPALIRSSAREFAPD
jgi:carbamoyltransferase